MKRRPYHCDVKHPYATCMMCGKPIKMNVFARKERPVTLCYRHYKMRHLGHSKRDFNTWDRPVTNDWSSIIKAGSIQR